MCTTTCIDFVSCLPYNSWVSLVIVHWLARTFLWQTRCICSYMEVIDLKSKVRSIGKLYTHTHSHLFQTYYTIYNLYLIPCTLYLIPCTLYLIPYTLYLIPYTLYLIPCTLYLILSLASFKPYGWTNGERKKGRWRWVKIKNFRRFFHLSHAQHISKALTIISECTHHSNQCLITQLNNKVLQVDEVLPVLILRGARLHLKTFLIIT